MAYRRRRRERRHGPNGCTKKLNLPIFRDSSSDNAITYDDWRSKVDNYVREGHSHQLIRDSVLSALEGRPHHTAKAAMVDGDAMVVASFNTGAVEDVCDVVLDSWWCSQWRLDWWAWCVLIWNKIFGNFIYVPVGVKSFFCLLVDPTGFLGRRIYSISGRKSSSFSDKSWGCWFVFLLLSTYSCIQSICATAFLCICIYNLNTVSRTR